MSFDPEKVERSADEMGNPIVYAEDYDQLLGLYRAILLSFGPKGSLGYIAAANGQLPAEWPHAAAPHPQSRANPLP